MIIHYLGIEPADDLDLYIKQAACAHFLEQRYFDTMAKIMGATK